MTVRFGDHLMRLSGGAPFSFKLLALRGEESPVISCVAWPNRTRYRHWFWPSAVVADPTTRTGATSQRCLKRSIDP
jgi:hypothetical protein